MQFTQPTSGFFVPDADAPDRAASKTTILGVGAHQDDIEILAYPGILRAFGREDQWFGAVIATNGSGSARDNLYADYTDDEMKQVRRREQCKAAVVGEYSFAAFLDYSSAELKDPANLSPVADLQRLLEATRPEAVYTHNPADKHDTHVAVVLCLVEALRRVPESCRPTEAYGCEVWRNLDWVCDDEKIALDASGHENIAAALVGIFDSQICGGKRYDLATMGRRRANATYHASHATDTTDGLVFAMDLMPLVRAPYCAPVDHVGALIDNFRADVEARITKLTRTPACT